MLRKLQRDINVEENVMRYCLMPTLKHTSAVNIVIRLWRHTDAKLYAKLFNHDGRDCLNRATILRMRGQIKEKVSDGISQLPVPDAVRKDLSDSVDPIGLEIYNWIINHEKYIFSGDPGWHLFGKTRVMNFMDDLVWTPSGRIDYQRTAKSILDNRHLSVQSQYDLACTYCLEDDIAILAPRIYALPVGSLDVDGMLFFWTSHVAGDFTLLDREVDSYNAENGTDCSTNEYIFRALSGDIKNQVAIRYMWGKLSDEEKSRQCASAIERSSSTDIHCFLLSQLNEEQQQRVFETCASQILLSLLDDWLWGEYFLPTLHHVWNVVTECNYLSILEAIVRKMEENHNDIEKFGHYRATFMESWQCAPEHLKECVLEHENGHRGRNLFYRLFCVRNLDIIRSLLLNSNYAQKKNIIFSVCGFNECDFLIARDRWDLLQIFIELTLASGDDVDYFKKEYLKARGQYAVVSFIRKKEWNKVEQLEKWAFKSDEEIKEFRRGLTHSGICRFLLQTVVAKNRADFTDLEHFFKWCALGDEKGVTRLKEEIPQLQFSEVICKIIEKDMYEFLESILNWCFANDQKKIDQFRRNICYDHRSYQILDLVVNLIKQDDNLQSLERFIRWSFTNELEINKFKGWVLHILRDTEGVCIKLLRQRFLKLADDFINWCCNSSRVQVDYYKSQLMCHDNIDDVFREYNFAIEGLTEVITWFNPSEETVETFKVKNMIFEWFEDILPVLNNHVREHIV